MIKRYQAGHRMSQAVVAGGFVHVAGQVADDREADIQGQTRDVLAKIDALLQEACTSKSKLVAVNVFLAHIVDFEAMNSVYDAWLDPQIPRRGPASRHVLPIPESESRGRRLAWSDKNTARTSLRDHGSKLIRRERVERQVVSKRFRHSLDQ